MTMINVNLRPPTKAVKVYCSGHAEVAKKTVKHQGAVLRAVHGPLGHPTRRVGGFSWEKYMIMIIVGVILLLGIKWGLPNECRNELLLGDKALTDLQIQQLNDLRGRLNSGDEWQVKQARSLRAFIVAPVSTDEQKAYTALFRMDPGRLNFDPRGHFLYGGTYLYILGLQLYALKLTGLLHVTEDFYYYLKNPGVIASAYMAGRAINIASFLRTLFLLGMLGDKFGGRISGTVAVLSLALSTAALDVVLVSKPHVYAALWVTLSVYLTICHVERNSWGHLIGASVAAGWAFGAAITAGVTALIFPILLWDHTNIRKTGFKILIAWTIMVMVFFIANPYVICKFAKFFEVLTTWSSSDEHAVFSSQKALRYLMSLFVQSYCFPIGIVAVVTIIVTLAHESGLIRRMACMTVCLIVSTLGLEFPRLSLFCGPLICFFAGYGIARFFHFIPKRLVAVRASILLVLFSPGFVFASMWARDVIWDEPWREPTWAWIGSFDIDKATIGVFTPYCDYSVLPYTTPPFPFIHARMVAMETYPPEEMPPDYVLVSSKWNIADKWASHPLRAKYVLTDILGFRESYNWFLDFRVQSESCLASWVYKRVDP